MGIKGTLAAVATVGLLVGGCATKEPGRHAMAQLEPASGSTVRGTVHFYETPKGIRVVAKISGLTPGQHGFHIHEKGDCSKPDATSAGGHFNPGGAKHGAPTDGERHAGDFGNLTADAAGNAKADFVDGHISFNGPNSIVDRGVIVHEKADDLKSQPAGNAGARVACGNIMLH